MGPWACMGPARVATAQHTSGLLPFFNPAEVCREYVSATRAGKLRAPTTLVVEKYLVPGTCTVLTTVPVRAVRRRTQVRK